MKICDEPDTKLLALISLSIVVLIEAVKLFNELVEISKAFNLLSCPKLYVATDELNELILADNELDKAPILLDIEPLIEPKLELKLDVVVATEELNAPIELDTDPLNEDTEELIDVFIEELKVL
jgi:hypothetical protein